MEPAGPPMAGPVDGGVMGRTVDRVGPFSRGCQGYGPGVSVILPGTRTSRLAYLLISARKEDMQIPREGITSVIIFVIVGNAVAAALWPNKLRTIPKNAPQ